MKKRPIPVCMRFTPADLQAVEDMRQELPSAIRPSRHKLLLEAMRAGLRTLAVSLPREASDERVN